MATIEKRTGKRGTTWRARIRRTGYPDLTETFSTKTAALEWARATESKVDKDEVVDTTEARRTTLTEALDRYQREITPAKKGATQERNRIAVWKRASLATKTLSRIRGTDVAKWRDERLEAGVSGQTIRNDLALLSHVFKIARTEWGMESLRNPVDDVRRPKGSPARERRLQPGEEGALLQHADTEWSALIILAIETAMRRGELLGLTHDDIDRKRGVAHLPKTKNGSPRDVPLSPRALAAIKTLPRRLDGRLFSLELNDHGNRWRALCDKAGVEGLRFHDLRHEGTSRLVESGLWNMAEIGKITGHKTLAMLARYYQPNAAAMAARMKTGERA